MPGVLDSLSLLAIAGWALWSPLFRTWRTVLLLVVVGALLVIASGLPFLLGLALRLAAYAGLLGLLVLRGDLMWSMSRADRAFDRGFWRGLERLSRLGVERTAGRVSADGYVKEFSSIIPMFRELDAPSEDWRTLQIDMLAHLSSRLAAYLELQNAGRERGSAAHGEEAAELRQRYLRLRSSKARFWR